MGPRFHPLRPCWAAGWVAKASLQRLPVPRLVGAARAQGQVPLLPLLLRLRLLRRGRRRERAGLGCRCQAEAAGPRHSSSLG